MYDFELDDQGFFFFLITSELALEGKKESSMDPSGGRVLQARETTNAKVWWQEIFHVLGEKEIKPQCG